MPLHFRRRPRSPYWYIGGTVRVGRETIAVPEFSSGCRARADAEAAAAAEEARVRTDALEGRSGQSRRLTIADCLLIYLRRPGGVVRNDKDKITDIATRIGTFSLADAALAWAALLRTRGEKWTPGTAARWRAVLQAAIRAGCEAHGIPWPRLPTVKEPTTEIATYLTQQEQDTLLAAYNPSAGAVALALCFAGLRTQEALRLDWRHVDWARGVLIIVGASVESGAVRRRTKSGRGRSVPMHARLHAKLEQLWQERGRPDRGTVFLSARGEPYRDTGAAEVRGGNPLKRAHDTACRRAGVGNFRVHDWRHHWASWMVMRGCDLYTLMKLGGWSTPRMVQRYASVSGEHMAAAIGRLG